MPRPPSETVSQRELLLRYRILLDEAMRLPPDGRRTVRQQRARQRILELAKENPRATISSHVLRNIGKRRRIWLIEFLDQEKPKWLKPEPTSTSKT